MIAHRIQRKSGKDLYGRLACYISDVQTSVDPKVFDRLATYIADQKGADERVVGLRITNCAAGDDFALAVKEIENTQASNKRGKGDKSYHLVIAFPEGERPSLEQLRQIEDSMIAAIGLEDHQRISAIHDDTDNLHVHVAINKVHPTTRRLVEPFYDKQKLMAACIALEKEHGLIQVNHGERAERLVNRVGSKMEAYSGRLSLQKWVADEAAGDLRAGLANAANWQDLHKVFQSQGLELRLRGAGLVAAAIGQRATIKASSIDRAFSLGSLAKRFGEFEEAAVAIKAEAPQRQYVPAAAHGSPDGKALYAEYQAQREEAVRLRAMARVDLAASHDTYGQRLRRHYKERLASLRSEVYLRGDEKARRRAEIAAERDRDLATRRDAAKLQRQQIDAANPLLTWQAFLQREAERGDERAVTSLRRQHDSRSRIAGDILTAADLTKARDVVAKRQQVSAKRNGDMVYTVADGGRVTDQVDVIRMDALSTAAALLALELAEVRFGDQPLVIEGTDAFVAAIVSVAALPGSTIRFSDPELEARRQAAIARRGMDFDPAISGAATYAAERNARRETVAAVPVHRVWTAADVGEFAFAGRRAFQDGSEGVLLERGGEIFVKPAGDVQMAKASSWERGATVNVDGQGRFRAGKQPAPEQGPDISQ